MKTNHTLTNNWNPQEMKVQNYSLGWIVGSLSVGVEGDQKLFPICAQRVYVRGLVLGL